MTKKRQVGKNASYLKKSALPGKRQRNNNDSMGKAASYRIRANTQDGGMQRLCCNVVSGRLTWQVPVTGAVVNICFQQKGRYHGTDHSRHFTKESLCSGVARCTLPVSAGAPGGVLIRPMSWWHDRSGVIRLPHSETCGQRWLCNPPERRLN